MSYQWNGVGKVNVANEVMTINDRNGAILVSVQSDAPVADPHQLGISFCKDSAPNTPILTDQDTQVTAEDTGYDGNAALLIFTGNALNVLPIIPKSLTVIPAAGGNTVNATDRDGDGKLYTYDVDEDLCGTIDYNTGDLDLSYPLGKDPNNGDIDATYKSTVAIVALGVLSYRIDNLKHSESIKVYACAQSAPTPLKIDVYGG